MGTYLLNWLALAVLAAGATPNSIEAKVAQGAWQVKNGDYAIAISTLEDAIRQISADPGRKALLVQAYVHLAVAHHATGAVDATVAELGAAIDLDPGLRLSAEEVHADVVAIFGQLRAQRLQSSAAGRAASRRSVVRKSTAIVGGGTAVAGGTIALLRATSTEQPALVVTDARVGTPVVVCNNFVDNVPVGFVLLVDVRARNDVAITGAHVKSIFVFAGGTASATVLSSAKPSPSSIAPGTSATLRIDSLLTCSNRVGDPPSFGFMRFAGVLETSVGQFEFETTTTALRFELP